MTEYQEDDNRPFFQRLRGSVFPIGPTDSWFGRLLKNSGFYFFALMAALVTVVLFGVVMFVL